MNEACDNENKNVVFTRYIEYCPRKINSRHAIEDSFHFGKGLLVAIKGRREINVGLVSFELKA